VRIDWASLRTAHGNAAHVPDALVRLHSDREDARRSAYWQLDNYVVLQGSLFEAAPFVADELIRVYENPRGAGHVGPEHALSVSGAYPLWIS
jgi:hypothetical protein